eukprot:13436614-Alexandrium_andersonii.AAC.1
MSASLVGSEMCIRDRKWGDRGSREWQGVGRAQTSSNERPVRSSYGTVSYTHLTLPTICSV